MIKLYSTSDGWLVFGTRQEFLDLALECESCGSDAMYHLARGIYHSEPPAIYIEPATTANARARTNSELFQCLANVQRDQNVANRAARALSELCES